MEIENAQIIADISPQAVIMPIGSEQVAEARQILQRYKQGKAMYEQKIVANYEWYKVRHWEQMSKAPSQIEPSSAWLFNVLANKHADAMDNYPAPRILPREASDQAEAKMLSDIIPAILEQDNFEQTYSDGTQYKNIVGAAAYGTFWDSSKLNGQGDVTVKMIDLLNLFWEPGIMDIQRSANVFHLELRDNDELAAKYPQLKDTLSSPTIDIAKYRYDDNVDTSDKSVVVDWYYKKINSSGKQVLHYVKFVNDVVLYATENTPETSETGWYDDGEYPFDVDVLYPLWGQVGGLGYIDIGKSDQEYIDRLRQAILKNALANAAPRYFSRENGGINEQEYVDYTKPIVHVPNGNFDISLKAIDGKPLSGAYLNVLQMTIDELKETTGTRDVATGGTTSGVTAASAIAAMQEAGSKLSRDSNKATYRCFRRVIGRVIERIRQFYDLPRTFRILGADGATRFVQYTNAGIKAQPQGTAFGVDLGQRIPLFDVDIVAEKQSPYARISQNELAMQFYGLHFFDPANMEQALATLSMMDFDGKDQVMQTIIENGVKYQQAQAAAMVMGLPVMEAGASGENYQVPDVQATGGEASNTQKARARVAESTAPR